MVEKYQDRSTIASARIHVDYKGKKPKVKFSFPGDPKKNKTSAIGYSFLITFGIYLFIFVVVCLSVWGYKEFVLQEDNPYYYKYSSCMEYQEDNQKNVCKNYADNGTASSYLNEFGLYSSAPISLKENIKKSLLHLLPIGLIFSIVFFGFGKKLKTNAPKIEAGANTIRTGIDHYRKIFHPKDVTGSYVEIPLFNNIKLDYNATKEFSKYLEEVKITEHPFQAIEYKSSLFKKEHKKVLPNEYLWRARFYFSQKPNTGKLEVKWK